MHISVISPDLYTYGAMLIGGIVRDAGYDVSISREMKAGRGDVVLLSLYSTQHLLDERIRSFIRRHQADGGICYAGGPVSSCPEMVLKELGIDAVVIGEGEEVVVPLIQDGISDDLDGIAYLSGSETRCNPVDVPSSIEHPVPLIPGDIGGQSIRGASVYIETHRGCIGACTFCQVPRFFGRSIRSREIDAIIAEVKEFKRMGARRISISGGTGSLYKYTDGRINVDAFIELLSALADVMGSRNVSSPDIRVDCISDEILDAIKEYTIGWVFFGIESGSDRILHDMGKGVTSSQVEDAVSLCRSHGLSVAGSFIVGYPTETPDDYEMTKDLMTALSLDDVFVSIAEPIPGTPLASLVLRTQKEENPVFYPHEGEYSSLRISESEGRCFDLMMHADMCKPQLHVVTDQVFDTYLAETRKQGREIRAATELLFRYRDSKFL